MQRATNERRLDDAPAVNLVGEILWLEVCEARPESNEWRPRHL
jgi:hypothetical protein